MVKKHSDKTVGIWLNHPLMANVDVAPTHQLSVIKGSTTLTVQLLLSAMYTGVPLITDIM